MYFPISFTTTIFARSLTMHDWVSENRVLIKSVMIKTGSNAFDTNLNTLNYLTFAKPYYYIDNGSGGFHSTEFNCYAIILGI